MKKRYRERLSRRVRRSESPWALVGASIAESTVVPIPIELIITPMMTLDRGRRRAIAAWTLLGSVVGTSAVYVVGAFLFDVADRPLIEAAGREGLFDEVLRRFRDDGIITVAFISVTPMPLVPAAIGAGAAKTSFPAFLAVVTLTRAIRYLGLALLVQLFGEKVREGVHRLSHDRTARTARIVSIVATVIVGGLLIRATR